MEGKILFLGFLWGTVFNPTMIGLFLSAEVRDIELNLNLRRAVNSMQMPKVEYREINIEDYSMLSKLCSNAGV